MPVLSSSSQILDSIIDEEDYLVGPGDLFLLNMTTANGVITIELLISPTGDVLIPVVGKVNLKGNNLKDAYEIMISKCKEKYEDAFVYVNLIRLRQFKVLITGSSDYSGMHVISSSHRTSDLVQALNKDISYLNELDTLLNAHLFEYPKNIMISKDISLIRNDSIINIDLFDYYINGNDSSNPILIEGDILNIKNTDKVTVLGEVNNPIRIKKENLMTYNNLLQKAGGVTSMGELYKIKFLNSGNISSYYNNEKNRISKITSQYRSDTDESFLSARSKTTGGMIYISDNLKLKEFLSSELSKGDILIVPRKSNFIEILGGVNNPGSYMHHKGNTVYDYILNAGGYNDLAKDIFILDVNSGARLKVSKSFIPDSGTIIFVEEKIGYKKWDRIKDIVGLSASIMSVLLLIANLSMEQ